ncbi:MAG: hypothetical protein ACRD8U_25035 [Pyrinomonadaceae bacterium]
MKNMFLRLLLVVLLFLAANPSAAQDNQTLVNNYLSSTTKPSTNQTVTASLATLPEADMLIFINPQRFLNEAMPRLLPEKDLVEMRKSFAAVNQFAGVDPSKVNYVVMAVRVRKPSAELSFNPPEVMIVAGGDFSADSLIALARAASGGRLRDEKHGAKTLSLMTIDPIAKEAEKNPFLKSFTEVAIVPLNANTIAAGTTAYIRAAVDAAEGSGRISPENLGSLLREPSALISIAGSPLVSFSKSFGLMGTEANPRAPRCDTRFSDFYAAVTMDATHFKLRGALNADNPDTAKIINGLVAGLVRQASSAVPDKNVQSALQNLSITAQEDEVVLSADFPQQMVIDFFREQMKPKKAMTATKPAPKGPVVRKPILNKRRTKKS